jgi:hypothetical protein
VVQEKRPRPVYKGMINYIDPAGFSIWLPDDWKKIELTGEHEGVLYTPVPDDINTGFLAKRHRLQRRVKKSDMPVIRDVFMADVRALEGVEIDEDSVEEYITDRLSFFQVRFTFPEGDVRRKRWIKNIYWGKNNYVLIAQGSTIEDFDYWLPMFYQIMINAKI